MGQFEPGPGESVCEELWIGMKASGDRLVEGVCPQCDVCGCHHRRVLVWTDRGHLARRPAAAPFAGIH
jgi:hypothetical protein